MKKLKTIYPQKVSLQSAELQKKFADPSYMIEFMADYLRSGDFESITDIIAAYIANCPKYKSQDEFAKAIGTNRQTLYRMMAHQNVSMNVLFAAVERIYKDQK
ncbi:MAG: hypothetical protein ACLGG0_12980 [Bacteriovoracia bacterium]